MDDYQLVRYIGGYDPQRLRCWKFYAARLLTNGGYGIIDETNVEHTYPPAYFEAVESNTVRCVIAELRLGEHVLIGFDLPLPLKNCDAIECDGEIFLFTVPYDLPRSIGIKSEKSFKGKVVEFVHWVERHGAYDKDF